VLLSPVAWTQDCLRLRPLLYATASGDNAEEAIVVHLLLLLLFFDSIIKHINAIETRGERAIITVCERNNVKVWRKSFQPAPQPNEIFGRSPQRCGVK